MIIICQIFLVDYSLAQNHDYNFLQRIQGTSPRTYSGAKISYIDSTQSIKIDRFEWQGGIINSPVLSNSEGDFLGYTNNIPERIKAKNELKWMVMKRNMTEVGNK